MERALNTVLEKELAELENKRSARTNARTAIKRTIDEDDDEDSLYIDLPQKRFSVIGSKTDKGYVGNFVTADLVQEKSKNGLVNESEENDLLQPDSTRKSFVPYSQTKNAEIRKNSGVSITNDTKDHSIEIIPYDKTPAKTERAVDPPTTAGKHNSIENRVSLSIDDSVAFEQGYKPRLIQTEVRHSWQKKTLKYAILSTVFLLVAAGLIALGAGGMHVFRKRQQKSVKIVLDYQNFLLLQDKPDSYQASQFYVPFKFILPAEYLRSGDSQLKSVLAYYTDFNMCGIQFTFNNGITDYVTELYGVSQNPNGKPTSSQIFNVTDPITSVNHLMINTQLTPKGDVKSGWYIVNIGLKSKKEAALLGNQETRYPLEYAIRNPL